MTTELMAERHGDWACDECAEKAPDVYDDGKVFEPDPDVSKRLGGLTCEVCGKPTLRLTIPRREPE